MPTKGPHTHVWIVLAGGLYDVETRQKVARARKEKLEQIYNKMLWEGETPVWQSMLRDFGNPMTQRFVAAQPPLQAPEKWR